MASELLFLYTRKSCCICQSLEERLGNIPLKNLIIPLKLIIMDIDTDEVSEDEKKRYDLEVPVLILDIKKNATRIQLPRISPRLKGERLMDWLDKKIVVYIS